LNTDFFLEWEIESTGDQTELLSTAPANISLYNDIGFIYHFTIARDRIRVLVDIDKGSSFYDIKAGIPHRYYLVILDGYYALYVDNVLTSDGAPEGPLALGTQGINIHARAKFFESVTTWYYVRFGEIPAAGSADFNSDGLVDEFDHFYIAECIDRSTAGEPAAPSCTWADVDDNDTVDCTDWEIIQAEIWTSPEGPSPIYTCVGAIPTTSEWGLAIFALFTATVGTLVYRQSAPAHV
jgi:hypothetical protein